MKHCRLALLEKWGSVDSQPEESHNFKDARFDFSQRAKVEKFLTALESIEQLKDMLTSQFDAEEQTLDAVLARLQKADR